MFFLGLNVFEDRLPLSREKGPSQAINGAPCPAALPLSVLGTGLTPAHPRLPQRLGQTSYVPEKASQKSCPCAHPLPPALLKTTDIRSKGPKMHRRKENPAMK